MLNLVDTEVLIDPSLTSFGAVVSYHIFGDGKLTKLIG
jgi:hypothetical protein